MKSNSRRGDLISGGNTLNIRTTILELVRAFNDQSRDDGLVVAAVSQLLSSGRVRSARSLMPVKVVASQEVANLRGSLTDRRRQRTGFSHCR